MDNHIYKKIEIVGSSDISSDDAVKQALKRASNSIQNLRWFEVIESRGSIKDGVIDHWQVTVKIGFTMN